MRTPLRILVCVLLVAGGVAGGFALAEHRSPDSLSVQQEVDVLADLYRQAEHNRHMAGVYQKQSAIPPETVLTAAERGDQKAQDLVKDSAIASDRVNGHHFECSDLAVAYNRLAAQITRTQTGKNAILKRRLLVTYPTSQGKHRCWWHPEDDAFVPGNSQYYNK